MQLKLSQLDAHLNKTLAPLYVLHGDEVLLQIEAADAIRAAARRGGCGERQVYVAESGFNWNELLAANQMGSLFAERSLIDLRIPSGKPGAEGATFIEAYCASLNPSNITLVTLPRPDRAALSSKWFTALEEKAVTIGIPSVDRDELPRWIQARLAQQKQCAQPQTLQFLVERTEGNLLAAHQEIAKLAQLLPEGELDHDAVEAAVLNVARYDISELSAAWLRGDAPRFYRVLSGLRAEGESVQFVLWHLNEDLHALHTILEEVEAGTSLAASMRNVRAWGKRQSLLERAAQRVSIKTIRVLLALGTRLDALAKGLGSGNIWDEIASVGLRLCGVRVVGSVFLPPHLTDSGIR